MCEQTDREKAVNALVFATNRMHDAFANHSIDIGTVFQHHSEDPRLRYLGAECFNPRPAYAGHWIGEQLLHDGLDPCGGSAPGERCRHGGAYLGIGMVRQWPQPRKNDGGSGVRT